MKNFCTTFFRGLDMYTTPATLRSRGEAGVASICLGVFSTLLLGLFLTLFISNLVKIVNRDSDTINYSQTLTKDFDGRTVDYVMFGITIDFDGVLDINTFPQYFTTKAKIRNKTDNGYYQINFQKCKPQHWKQIGEQYQTYFNDWGLSRSYCLPSILSISSNKTDFPFAKLQFNKCVNNTNNNDFCKSDTDIKAFYDRIIAKNQNFPLYLSFLSSYVQANDKDPLKYYIYAPRFATTSETGQQIYMYLDKFIIDTDISLLPIIEQHEFQQGYAVSQNFFADFYFSGGLPQEIFEVQVYTSKNVLKYSRNLSKIDQALSYVGGLFGLVVFFFNFFLQPFNQYRYELMASESSFNYNTDGKRVRQDEFNFLSFLKYRLYFWLNIITGGKFKWKACQQIDETLVESRKLLDVEKLFRRIQFMERVLWKKTDNNLLMSMTLLQHNSIEQTKKKRMILDYYKQVIQLQEAATVQDAFNDSKQSFTYLPKVFQRVEKHKMKNGEVPAGKLRRKRTQLQRLQSLSLGQSSETYLQPEFQQQCREIKQSLMEDLNLREDPLICQKVSRYPILSEDAQIFQFDEQEDGQEYMDIEKQITEAFLDLDPKLRLQVLPKIPIKILHRLRFRAIEIKNKKKTQSANGSQGQKQNKSD